VQFELMTADGRLFGFDIWDWSMIVGGSLLVRLVVLLVQTVQTRRLGISDALGIPPIQFGRRPHLARIIRWLGLFTDVGVPGGEITSSSWLGS
jgi:hypothetical protein